MIRMIQFYIFLVSYFSHEISTATLSPGYLEEDPNDPDGDINSALPLYMRSRRIQTR